MPSKITSKTSEAPRGKKWKVPFWQSHPHLQAEIHADNPSWVWQLTAGSDKKILWRIECKPGVFHDMQCRVQARTRGRGCNHPDCVQERRRQSCLQKYGVANCSDLLDVKEKRKRTNLLRYGVEHALQNAAVRRKLVQTCMVRYGSKNAAQCDRVQRKMKQTCVKRYGVENVFAHPQVKEHIKRVVQSKYGVSNVGRSPAVRQKAKLTCLLRYGTSNPNQNAAVRRKATESCKQSYGVSYPLQNRQIRERARATCRLKYGFDYPAQHPAVQKKTEETCRKKYGVDNPNQNPLVRQKARETCRQRYGVNNVMQNAVVAQKSSENALRHKMYVFPSGRTEYIQGYEHFCLDNLIHQEGISENVIETAKPKVPVIWWTDENGMRHRYYVDIWIKPIHLIEVKSRYTMMIKTEIIIKKLSAAAKAGFVAELRVYDNRGQLVEKRIWRRQDTPFLPYTSLSTIGVSW